jgi:hypothetical protein
LILTGLFLTVTHTFAQSHSVTIVLPSQPAPRIQFGAQRLNTALKALKNSAAQTSRRKIIITLTSAASQPDGQPPVLPASGLPPRLPAGGQPESFSITEQNEVIRIDASDPSGALYGCLELAYRITHDGWPDTIQLQDHPAMIQRGSCIDMEEPTLLPARTYNPNQHTPADFLWLYDKKFWLRYLDSMVDNRLNTLCLRNGHSFDSLAARPGYATYRFLTAEADKRGIRVIRQFHKMTVSQPFAEHGRPDTPDSNRPVIPLFTAYFEPFRYGSPDFIQNYVRAMHSVYDANSLYLDPQASNGDWPFSADLPSRLLEMDRDWIVYAAWARYAWNDNRDRREEISYWSSRLASKFGCDTGLGKDILMAYEQAGDIIPNILRWFAIADSNHQTLTLGMGMTQLINPERYGAPSSVLYRAKGHPGESLKDYVEISWDHGHHSGETPINVINDIRNEGRAAAASIDAAAAFITKDRLEFIRLQNDMHCYKALADCYAFKAEAALDIIHYRYTNDVANLEKALPLLEASLNAFRELTRLATPAYRYADSRQTRRQGMPIANPKFTAWTDRLPVYENELERLRFHIDSLRQIAAAPTTRAANAASTDIPATAAPPAASADPIPASFQPATVQWRSPIFEAYPPDSGALMFTDTTYNIRFIASPLRNLKFIRESYKLQSQQGTHIAFSTTEPVDLLIGFINDRSPLYCPAPQPGTDTSANDYGQVEPRIVNGMVINGMAPVNIHVWSFRPGMHTLDLGKGICLVLGFVKPIGKQSYDAGLSNPAKKNVDWLFE